jgi:tetratricopeptide (TPR) repeat protein
MEKSMRAACALVAIAVLLSCSGESRNRTETLELPDFNAMWDFDNPALTEARFREILPEAGKSGDAGYYAELLTQIARAEGLQRKFEEAHATLDSAYAAIPDTNSTAMVRYLLERGRVYNSSGDPGASREYFLKAYDLAQRTGSDFYAIDALHMLAIVAPTEEQMMWNLRALDMAEDSTDERARRWRGSLYNNIGWTYHDMGDYEKALEMFERSLAFREDAGDSAGILIAKWTIARTRRSLGDVDEALKMQLELEKDVEEYGLPPDGYVYEEIAECLLLTGRPEEAARYFKMAYEVLSKDEWLAANDPDRLERLERLSH